MARIIVLELLRSESFEMYKKGESTFTALGNFENANVFWSYKQLVGRIKNTVVEKSQGSQVF